MSDEKKRRRFSWTPIAIGGLLVVSFAVVLACQGLYVLAPDRSTDLGRALHPYRIEYRILSPGSRGQANIVYYTDPNRTERVDAAGLPWSKRLNLYTTSAAGLIMQVSGQSLAASGEIRCEIYVDGVKVREAKAAGSYSTVTCSARL